MLTTENGGALFGRVPGPKQKTMKVKILKDCIVGGKSAKAGATVPVKEQDAKLLIGMKKAEPVVESKKTEAEGKGQKVKDREADIKEKVSER